MDERFKIVGIEYSIHTPMVYGEDFDIVMTSKEIISSSFFLHDKDSGVPTKIATRNHVKVREAMYKDIVDTIMSFAHTLEEIPDRKPSIKDRIHNKLHKTQELDGPNEFLFHLTWSDGEETIVKKYKHPNDRRFLTVIELLEESVNPEGRKIPRFSCPEIDGIHFYHGEVNDKDYYSYQCTLKERGRKTERHFFHHYNENGEHKYVSLTVGDEEWKRIRHLILEKRYDKKPRSTKNKNKGCTIYISDETSKDIELSQEEERELYSLFLEIESKVEA